MVNRPRIQTVLENTGLVDVVRERISGGGSEDPEITSDSDQDDEDETIEPLPDELPGPEQQPDETEAPLEETREPDGGEETETPEGGDEPDDDSDEQEGAEQEGAENEEEEEQEETPPGASESEEEAEEAEESNLRTRQARLYFVRVTDDGAFPEPVTKTIEYEDRPLTETINALIEGPNGDEGADGLMNLIPEGTQLRSARVSNGVAYLDFNEAFQFNPMGVEGYRMQLKQIVFATTEFQSIDRVQFLIDGERREWLGGEGVYIGTPLGRDSLS